MPFSLGSLFGAGRGLAALGGGALGAAGGFAAGRATAKGGSRGGTVEGRASHGNGRWLVVRKPNGRLSFIQLKGKRPPFAHHAKAAPKPQVIMVKAASGGKN